MSGRVVELDSCGSLEIGKLFGGLLVVIYRCNRIEEWGTGDVMFIS